MSKNTCFTDENTPSPRVSTQTRPHMYVQNVAVCTGTTRTCFNTCARNAGIHGDVLNVHTEAFFLKSKRVFQRFTPHHNTAHTTQTTHHTTTQDTTPHGDRQRQTETEKEDRYRGRRGDEREDDKTRAERREKSEEREDSFSVWWCTAVFYWCSDFLVSSVCARDLSLPKSVKYDAI